MEPRTVPDPCEFRNPGAACRPVVMWIWNDDLDPVTLREQVADLAAKGVGGFFIHPMPDAFRKRDFIEGIKQPYPGEAFFGWVSAAAEAARQHGLACWLYDEGGWPSGTVTGALAHGRPEFAGSVLRVHRPAPHAGALPGEEVTSVPLADGRLRFYASREGYPVDLMNPAVTDAFLATVHEGYRARVGRDFGGLVPGVFTDEACVGGAMGTDCIPWTPELPALFRRRKGYDLLPWLAGLFAESAVPPGARADLSPERRARVRYDFGDVWTQLHADAFYGRMHEWCRRHHLLLIGHVGGEDDLAGHGTHHFGHFFRIMRHLDVPGVDAIWRQLFPGQLHPHFSKLAASAAHLEGKRLALSETFAVYGYGLTFRDMKWVTDRQFGDGINLMVPMAAHYTSTRGRAYCTMSNLAWGNPTWPLFRGYADYVGRLSYLLRLGRPAARVAVLYPAGSLWADAAPPIAASFHAVTDLLQEAQLDFDYIDEDTLARATVTGGAIRVADQAYQALVLPHVTVLPWTAVERLERLARQGGAVVAVDSLPRLCAEEAEQTRFAAAIAALFRAPGRRAHLLSTVARARLPKLVAGLIDRDLALTTPNPAVRYHHRVLGRRHLYFVVNAADSEQTITADVTGTGRAEVWDPDRGTTAEIAARPRGRTTRVRLTLPPRGALFLVLGRAGRGGRLASPPVPRSGRTIDGPWEFAPVRACRLVQGEPREEAVPVGCEAWRPAALQSWADLGFPEFSGSMAYRCGFGLSGPEAAGAVWLDLGEVKHAAEVWLNGRRVGTRLWPPFTLDVSGLARGGRNDLRVVVTNTWANQFLQPAEIAFATERGWYNSYARRVEPFQRESLASGLLGPVRLLFGPAGKATR